MKNFKIIFQTYAYDGNGDDKVVGTWERIIVAQDLEWAEKIAKAMRDEEVRDNLYLGDSVIVEETGEDPNINSWDDSDTWSWVIDNLGLDEDQVELIPHPGNPNEVVGIRVK